MRIVGMPSELPDALASAKRESLAAFGDDTLLLERYVARARHVEIQVFGDQYGTVLALGERECSIQRRHQKVIEEAPSPALTPSLRAAMSEAAVTLARAIDYTGAGTVEFLLDEDGRFAFLEMNTRLQVEHGVTELVTGIDLVDLQFRVTAGEPLPFSQEDVTLRGHAIECRIYAEDPAHGYLPSAGRLETFRPPDGPGIRNDVGVESGNVVSTYYDGMLAKLLVAGRTRADAIDRVALALRQYVVRGVTTNIPLLAATVDHRDFRAGKTFTSFLEEYEAGDSVQRVPPPEVLVASAVALANDGERGNPWQRGWRAAGEVHRVRICYGDGDAEIALTRTGPSEWSAGAGGETFTAVASGETVLVQHGATEQRIAVGRWGLEVAAVLDGAEWQTQPALLEMTRLAHADGFRGGTRAIKAPLTGVVVKVLAAEGDRVEAGQTIVVLDAMKMEHALAAPGSAVITRVAVQSGDLVQAGALLVELGDPPP